MDDMKSQLQLASIELAYARAEIGLTASLNDERQRIAHHLDSAKRHVDGLLKAMSSASKRRRSASGGAA